MKILLATDLYLPTVNGVVTSTVSLKNSLEQRGHDVRILTLAKTSDIDTEENVYVASSLNINKIYPGARVKLFKDHFVLNEIIAWAPEVIHTQSEFSTFRMAKYLAHCLSIPVVHTYHTIYEDYTHYFSPNKKTGKKVVALLTKKLLNNVDAVVAPTKKVECLLKKYEVSTPISIIPTGIQLAHFRRKQTYKKYLQLRKDYGIPEKAFLLIALGRLGKEKNINELLFFLSLLKIKVYLLVVGDGPYRDLLRMYTNDLGLDQQVKFTGMIEPKEVPVYYQMADLFVSASTSETQGLTYIEALASGLPILCRADEAVKDVVSEGRTGYTYRSFTEFETYLHLFIQEAELYQNMKMNAQEFAFANYSSENFGKNIEEIYVNVIKNYAHKKELQV